jgi:xanthine dehydrogenase YagT iron-sulfur-binding subunit
MGTDRDEKDPGSMGHCPEKEDTGDTTHHGLTRRGFFASLGAGAMAMSVVPTASAGPPFEVLKPEDMAEVTLQINTRHYRLLVEPRWSLLYALREKLGFTGTKPGCERGECGACTVLINGRPMYSCIVLAVEAEGCEVTTVEGLMNGEELGPVQRAFVEHDAFQCGYCTAGQVMAVEGLLRRHPQASLKEIRRAVSGNLCRCGSYDHIFKAAQKAAQLKSSTRE